MLSTRIAAHIEWKNSREKTQTRLFVDGIDDSKAKDIFFSVCFSVAEITNDFRLLDADEYCDFLVCSSSCVCSSGVATICLIVE